MMAQVSVSIGGRAYRLACNPGEEERLEALAATLDKKIAEMRESFGEIGDQRLTVMAALTIADEASEAHSSARREARRAEAALADAEAAHAEATAAHEAAERRAFALTAALDELTGRLGGLAAALSGKDGD
jgi:cell division protein ZapA